MHLKVVLNKNWQKSEAYSKHCQTSATERLAKIANSYNPWNVFKNVPYYLFERVVKTPMCSEKQFFSRQKYVFDLVSQVKSVRLHIGFYSGNVANLWGRYFQEHVQVTSFYICTVTSRKNSNIWNAVNINQVMTITFEFFYKINFKGFCKYWHQFWKIDPKNCSKTYVFVLFHFL